MTEIEKKLKKPFPLSEIRWRIGSNSLQFQNVVIEHLYTNVAVGLKMPVITFTQFKKGRDKKATVVHPDEFRGSALKSFKATTIFSIAPNYQSGEDRRGKTQGPREYCCLIWSKIWSINFMGGVRC